MKIIFTICSNNYLSQAKTLGDSLLVHNPDYTFIIGLTDEFDERIDYGLFSPHIILPVKNIGILQFDDLWKKYDIVEFNTCVKASYFKYIFSAYPKANNVCYFDPDIVVYHSLSILEEAFLENEILITPHVLSPVEIDDKHPSEYTFLNFGLYNLGFIGVHRNCTLQAGFLNWWENRILTLGYNKPCDGLYVDQLWINLVPIFFEKVILLKNIGLNVAPWNLHERTVLHTIDNKYKMNDGSPLYFFHFSSYNYKNIDALSKYYSRYSFETHKELKKLYIEYNVKLVGNKIDDFEKIECIYISRQKKYISDKNSWSSKINYIFLKTKQQLKWLLPVSVLKAIKKTAAINNSDI